MVASPYRYIQVMLGIIGFLFKELYFISFDEECACVAGLPVEWLNFIFILVVAGTISISVRLVGALLWQKAKRSFPPPVVA